MDESSKMDSSDEELPVYDIYSSVLENYTNMTITIRFGNRPPLHLPVADIDSGFAIKRRIRTILDCKQELETIELIPKNSSVNLSNTQSLAQLGIEDGAEFTLYFTSDMSKENVSEAKPNTTEDSDDDDEQPPEYVMVDRVRSGLNMNTNLSRRQYFCRLMLYIAAIIGILSVMVVLPIVLIVVGALNLDRCPARNSIPVWMIVFGTIVLCQTMMERLASLLRKRIAENLVRLPDYQVMPASTIRQHVDGEYQKRYRRLDQIDQLLHTCIFIWFVIGSVWVFGCGDCRDAFDSDLMIGCDHTAFQFSLVVIVILYILIAMPFLAIMVYMLWATFSEGGWRNGW